MSDGVFGVFPMKRLLFASTAACCLFGAASVAHAQEGFYFGAAGGVNFAEDLEIGDLSPCCVGGDREVDFDDGFAVLGVLGYMFPMGFRIEGEASYRENDVDRITVQGEGTATRDGDINIFALMANGWYDIQVFDNVQMHLGGGIGVGFLSFDINNAAVFTPPIRSIDEDATVFVYQIGGGLAYVLQNGVAFTADYRYFGTSDFDVSTMPFAVNIEADTEGYHSHSVIFGIRVPFSALGAVP